VLFQVLDAWKALTGCSQKSLGGRIISLPRGKVLGGSSAINGMVSTYPSREDIDRWAELGNEGWSFDDLEPYFRTSERFDAPSQKIAQFYETEDIINPELHKIKGPVATSFPVNRRVGADAWVKTFENVGLKLTTDPLSGEGLGGYTSVLLFSSVALL
jgi:choline dehydrogenase-like flavoprotein